MIDFNKISTIIFDFGGVIIDLNREKSLAEFEKIGLLDTAKMLDNFLPVDIFMQLEIGKLSEDEFLEKLILRSTQNPTKEQVKAAFLSFLQDIPVQKLDLILELKKHFKILLLSNTNLIHFAWCKKEKFNYNGLNINDFFDKCYLSYEQKTAKPENKIFEILLQEQNIKAAECLFFDDSPANIATAKSLNFNTILVDTKEDLRKYFREYYKHIEAKRRFDICNC